MYITKTLKTLKLINWIRNLMKENETVIDFKKNDGSPSRFYCATNEEGKLGKVADNFFGCFEGIDKYDKGEFEGGYKG